MQGCHLRLQGCVAPSGTHPWGGGGAPRRFLEGILMVPQRRVLSRCLLHGLALPHRHLHRALHLVLLSQVVDSARSCLQVPRWPHTCPSTAAVCVQGCFFPQHLKRSVILLGTSPWREPSSLSEGRGKGMSCHMPTSGSHRAAHSCQRQLVARRVPAKPGKH